MNEAELRDLVARLEVAIDIIGRSAAKLSPRETRAWVSLLAARRDLSTEFRNRELQRLGLAEPMPHSRRPIGDQQRACGR